MGKLKFVPAEDPVLRKRCKRVPQSDIEEKEVQKIIEDLLSFFDESGKKKGPKGVGLAANQVGILKRIILVDMAFGKKTGFRDIRVFLNPEIIWHSKSITK